MVYAMDPNNSVIKRWWCARKMPNGIMDEFFSKVNQKVNLGRCPMPSCPEKINNSEGPDQPVHPSSLIKASTVCLSTVESTAEK